jgi:hypothetical protein
MRQERQECWTDSGRREHGVQVSQRSRATVDTTIVEDIAKEVKEKRKGAEIITRVPAAVQGIDTLVVFSFRS